MMERNPIKPDSGASPRRSAEIDGGCSRLAGSMAALFCPGADKRVIEKKNKKEISCYAPPLRRDSDWRARPACGPETIRNCRARRQLAVAPHRRQPSRLGRASGRAIDVNCSIGCGHEPRRRLRRLIDLPIGSRRPFDRRQPSIGAGAGTGAR